MSIFRIYPEKSNTIASGVYKNYNSGQNAVTELWFGGGATSTAPEMRLSVSRFIVQFDLDTLQSKINNFEINPNLPIKYKLKMKNSIPRDKVLEPEFEFDKLEKSIATSYDLICFPINKYWDQGRGYDILKEFYVVKQYGNPLMTGYSNWVSATTLTAWDEPGIFINPTAHTSFYTKQHFDLGSEDLDMDITSIVNDWVSGGSSNYGLCVAFDYPFETMSTDTRSVASFYTEKTNTTFKPYIEVQYDQNIRDNRKQVTNNRISRLFLYSFSGGDLTSYFSAGTVSILDSSNSVVMTMQPQQMEKGVYYVDVLMSAATPGQKYYDLWQGITFVPGIDKQDIKQTFQIQKNYYLNSAPGVNDYILNTYGIDNACIFDINEVVKVFCDLRVSYSNNPPSTPYDLQYKIIQNNQLEVIPWTSVSQTVINDCSLNYFIIDTSWLQHNQTYKIMYRLNEFGAYKILSEEINFKVLRKF